MITFGFNSDLLILNFRKKLPEKFVSLQMWIKTCGWYQLFQKLLTELALSWSSTVNGISFHSFFPHNLSQQWFRGDFFTRNIACWLPYLREIVEIKSTTEILKHSELSIQAKSRGFEKWIVKKCYLTRKTWRQMSWRLIEVKGTFYTVRRLHRNWKENPLCSSLFEQGTLLKWRIEIGKLNHRLKRIRKFRLGNNWTHNT